MPMLYSRRTDNHIARPNLLNGLAPFLGTSQPGSDDQNLAYRMNMPMSTGTGLKSYAGSVGTHLVVGRVQAINTRITGKHFVRTLNRNLFLIADNDLHCLFRFRSGGMKNGHSAKHDER